MKTFREFLEEGRKRIKPGDLDKNSGTNRKLRKAHRQGKLV